MTLVELVYTSEVANSVTSDDIHHFVDRARIKNRRHGLSGVLISSPPYFIQLLEGKADEVIETFSAIQQDPRHHNVHVLYIGSLLERSFPDWDMGLIESTGDWQLDMRQFDRAIRRPSQDVSRGIQAIEEFYHQTSAVIA
jgi:hypothetical protein